jgi:predicted kinase
MRVVIMRGGSGFGKSTYIEKELPGATVVSADHFFGKGADYRKNFHVSKLGAAHKQCWDGFYDALNRQVPLIVVDNTNIKVRDFSKYVIEARKRGVEPEIVRLECDPEIAAKRNTHGVPHDICLRMAKELAEIKLPDDFPAEKVVKTDQPKESAK